MRKSCQGSAVLGRSAAQALAADAGAGRQPSLGILRAILGCAAVVVWFTVAISTASALGRAPAWSLRALAEPTNFTSAQNQICEHENERVTAVISCDRFEVIATNVGSLPSSAEPLTIRDVLPIGVTTAVEPGGANSV